MFHDTDPPPGTCDHCEPTRDLTARRRWTVPLVIALIGALVTVGGMAGTACSRAVETRTRVETMAEAQRDATEERQRLAAEQARSARETAQTLTEITRTLSRIEALVEQQQERERERPRGRSRTR